MIEPQPRAQSVMSLENRASFFSKTFSKLRRKKGSVSSVHNGNSNNPYSVGMGSHETPFSGKRFMSQPLLSLGMNVGVRPAETDPRERHSADVLSTMPAPAASTKVRHGPSHSITSALVAGTGVGIAVVDGLPAETASPASETRLATVCAPSVPPLASSSSLPRPSTSTAATGRTQPSLVRMPSSTSPYATARLSPTLITRAPMPILNFPPLPNLSIPSTSASTIATNAGTRGRGNDLRNMPALPRQGTVDDNTNDGDNDDSSSGSDGEGDADDGFVDAEEGESEEDTCAQPGHSTPRRTHLPPLTLDTSGWGAFMSGGIVQTPTQYESHAQTPTDYFSTTSSLPRRSPSSSSRHTPRIPPTPTSSMRIPQTPISARIPTILETPTESRPTIYKHASRSMINILGPAITRRDEETVQEESVEAEVTPIAPTPVTPASPAMSKNRQSTLTLSRRRSLPTFTAPGSPPPPYPSFAPHWRGGTGAGVGVEPPGFDAVHRHQGQAHIPEEQEDNGISEVPRHPQAKAAPDGLHSGGEMLPGYTNDIYLRCSMPRKMEFTAPGVQAKDRKWRRVVCELEGTVLRVFEDATASSGRLGAWWERRVGVGDVAVTSSTITAAPAVPARAAAASAAAGPSTNEQRETSHKSGDVDGGNQTELTIPMTPSSPAATRSILGRILTHGRSWSDIPSPSPTSATTPITTNSPGRASLGIVDDGRVRRSSDGRSRFGSSLNISRPHANTSASAPSISPSISSHSHSSSPSISSSTSSPSSGDSANLKLLHSYTLQNAESGLGNDYLKRKNVIRVRMEGEQFLLQAEDVASVVSWIEGLHAAANIALDLDERPMPRGPLFPRRRRRRRQATQTDAGLTTTTLNTNGNDAT